MSSAFSTDDHSSYVNSLSEWMSTYGEADYETPEKSKGGLTIHLNVNYPVTVRHAAVCRSERGAVQVVLDMDVRDGKTDAIVGNFRDWIELPFQPVTDLQLGDKEKVERLTKMRRNWLLTFLSFVDPKKYRVGALSSNEANGNALWSDWETQAQMTASQVEERRLLINREVLAFAKEQHRLLEDMNEVPLDDWAGIELWHHRKENPRNAKYPYCKYTRHPDKSMPVFSLEDREPF